MIVFLDLIDTDEERNKFEELYNKYKDLLYWIALKKLNNVEDAQECVQETFFYVAKNFGKIGDVASKSTKCYLSTIVTGFAVDVYNNSKKFKPVFDNGESALPPNDVDAAYFDDYEAVELLAVIDKLDDESRVYFYLKYIYGYKSSEIAQMYKIKDSYVRKKLQYSRELLKKYLSERI